MKEFGQELAKSAFPKKKGKRKPKPDDDLSPAQRKLHRKWLRQNKGVNLNPEVKPPKHQLGLAVVEPIAEAPNWSRVKYDQEGYTASEVAILMRPSPDMPLRVLVVMKHVRGYIDVNGSVLLRPTTAPSEQGGTLALPAPDEAAKGTRSAPRQVRTAAPIVLGGKYGLNPSKEGTKRFFIVESILAGGTPVEILKQADKMGRKQGGYKKGEIRHAIPANSKRVIEFAEQTVAKIVRAGRQVKVVVANKHITIKPEEDAAIQIATTT